MSTRISSHQSSMQALRARLRRYELTLSAIAGCTLTGADFAEWVKAAAEDATAGRWPECYACETAVHDGPCVSATAPPAGNDAPAPPIVQPDKKNFL